MNTRTTLNHIQELMAATLTSMLLITAYPALAQEEVRKDYIAYPHAFIGLQGGGQTTFTDYDNLKLITPTASLSVGVHFTPIIGARLHVNGLWNKSGICVDNINTKYKYNYATTDIDVMINMTNLLVKGNYHPLNVFLIGGAGFNYAYNNQDIPALRNYLATIDTRNRMSHNYRVGAMLDARIAPNWSVNLEVAANSLSDRFNSKHNGKCDWQLTAQIGLTYKFGAPHRSVNETPYSDIYANPSTFGTDTETEPAKTNVEIDKPKPTPAYEPKPTPKEESLPAPEPSPAPVIKDITLDIFFALRQTEVTTPYRDKLKEVAAWLKEHPSAKVTITGYADKGTGNPDINARFAKQRAESVTRILTREHGIESSRIATSSKGDTVQPFPYDNDKNRVAIVIGKE